MCSCEQRETKKESDSQKEAEIPRGQVSGDMKLAGVLFGIVMLADPHMCRELDRAQY